MDFLYSLFTRNSVQTSVDNKKANASVVVSTNVEHDYPDGRSSPSSAICDELSVSVSSHGIVVDFLDQVK
jgi:hypothetical protein